MRVKTTFLRCCRLAAVPTLLAAAASATDKPLRDIRLRLIGNERGGAVDAERRAALAEAERVEAEAVAQRDWTTAAESAALQALARALVFGDANGALARLRATRARYLAEAPEAVRRLYLTEAQILARLGNAAAIRALMDEFRASHAFDGRPFLYRVGEGHDTPMMIMRPRGAGENSITLTAMAKMLNRALTAPGAFFPTFEFSDIHGRRLTSADLNGAPVIVAFWANGSPIWKQQIRDIADVWKRYRSSGLQVVAINLDLEEDVLRLVSGRQPLSDWRVVSRTSAAAVAARLGLYGDPEILVLDRAGRIVARDVEAANLFEAVRIAAGSPP